jgi:hypothetical protein
VSGELQISGYVISIWKIEQQTHSRPLEETVEEGLRRADMPEE